MIALFKSKKSSLIKIIKLNKYNKSYNNLKLGFYDSKKSIFIYKSFLLNKYLKIGYKISKNLRNLLLQDLYYYLISKN
uniref:30S ribosomal protein S16 n=1 Tax=Nephromyces sp. ex Molgula occidentalis TaxID=2544991 RepID=A0A5C1H9X2_9APIC|nr:hypothetical protein [Nephromyces sp. ex Molgula occidentalis]